MKNPVVAYIVQFEKLPIDVFGYLFGRSNCRYALSQIAAELGGTIDIARLLYTQKGEQQ